LLYSTAYDELLVQVRSQLSVDDSTHMLIVLQRIGFLERGLVNKTYEEYMGVLLA